MATGNIRYLLKCREYDIPDEDMAKLEAAMPPLRALFDSIIAEWHDKRSTSVPLDNVSDLKDTLKSLKEDAETVRYVHRVLGNLTDPNASLGPVLTIPSPITESPSHL